MLEHHSGRDPLAGLQPAADAQTVRALIQVSRSIYAADAVKQYIVALVRATRNSPELRLGASPRSALHLLRAAKAYAAMNGRGHVLPDDVQLLTGPVLAHRLIPSAETQLARRSPQDVIAGIVSQVPLPTGRS